MTETTETILVKVEWGSRSSNGKWGYRAIAAMKAAGAVYDPDRKVWALPADAALSETTWRSLQVVS